MAADFDVLIIGGGAAGIGAARRLAMDNGLSFLLLEASARLGGRAWTQEIAGLPLDLGCGWLHSAGRNAWTKIAEHAGWRIDRGDPAWGRQYRDLGFPKADQQAAWAAFNAWMERLENDPPSSDRASDALPAHDPWNAYVQVINGFISGAPLDHLSVADYLAYDSASTDDNWRVPAGYGALITASLPTIPTRLSAPAEAIDLEGDGVSVTTPLGVVRGRAVILTVSTGVLAGDSIALPSVLDPWRHAASRLPLGRDEKLFLEIVGDAPFEPETQVLGDPRDPRTGSYYIRPLGRPVIEGFAGGQGALAVAEEGPAAGFAFALDQLAALFGSDIRRHLKPLVASAWSRSPRIGGAYSYALPGQAATRADLARPFDQRLFFAGEATNPTDFSTAHGAHDSGVRAADEVIAALSAGPADPAPFPSHTSGA